MSSLKEKVKNKYYHYYERFLIRWYKLNFPRLDKNIDRIKQITSFKDNNANVPGNLQPFFDSVKIAGIKPATSSIVDYGCGTGKILILAYKLKFKKVIGVELDEEGIKIARENVAKIRARNIEIIRADAVDYVLPSYINVIYFFNPFGSETMKQVIKRIKESCGENKRMITVIYQNPIERNVFLENGFKEIYSKDFKHYKPYFSILTFG